jgi:hypothetical protein
MNRKLNVYFVEKYGCPEVWIMAVLMKVQCSSTWGMEPCSLVNGSQRFGGDLNVLQCPSVDWLDFIRKGYNINLTYSLVMIHRHKKRTYRLKKGYTSIYQCLYQIKLHSNVFRPECGYLQVI